MLIEERIEHATTTDRFNLRTPQRTRKRSTTLNYHAKPPEDRDSRSRP